MTARSSRRHAAVSQDRIPGANSCSTGPGHMPISAPDCAYYPEAGLAPCRSRRPRARSSARRRAATPAAPPPAECRRRPGPRARAARRPTLLFPSVDESRGAAGRRASCCARIASSTGAIDGYADFDGFLARSRREAQEGQARAAPRAPKPASPSDRCTGMEIDAGLLGDGLTPVSAARSARPRSEPYLNRAFFRSWPTRLPEALLVIEAVCRGAGRRGGRYSSVGADTLYGRYWGSRGRFPQPALRDLLLPGHRVLHRARPAALRTRHTGRTQDQPRLPAGIAPGPRTGWPTARFRGRDRGVPRREARPRRCTTCGSRRITCPSAATGSR